MFLLLMRAGQKKKHGMIDTATIQPARYDAVIARFFIHNLKVIWNKVHIILSSPLHAHTHKHRECI